MTDFRFGKDRSCLRVEDCGWEMGKKNDDEYLEPLITGGNSIMEPEHLLFNWIDIPYLDLVEMSLQMPCLES
jgi:hypothetical protein